MIDEFRHRVDSLTAGRAAWDYNTLAALGDTGRVLYERVKGVAANLCLQSPQLF
jgi:hypothetical protein